MTAWSAKVSKRALLLRHREVLPAQLRGATRCHVVTNQLTRSQGWEASLELEPGLAQIIVKFLAFRLGRLARLVFAPPIGLGIAELDGVALLLRPRGVTVFPARVVSRQVGGCRAIVVGIHVNGNGGREAHAHVAGLGWITKAQPRNREDAVWQLQDVCHRARAIADDADGTAAKTCGLGSKDECLQSQRGIDARIEESLNVALRGGVMVSLADLL